ncbi:MAG: protoheme IX farnesyltransferase [Chitinophagales bacterium]|jgi:protoheme IX farnesyltransferase|nr:protoheme IX farnesyltransferase [Chitinophagales bacterium]HNI44204.1 heme o synthase [Chitinophagales bacterium]
MLSTTQTTTSSNLILKLNDYAILTKYRLNLTVVFSSVLGYLMAYNGQIEWVKILLLSLAGFLITGAANGFNQVLEKDYDKLMKRTANRPIAAGRMTTTEGVLIAGLCGIAGLLILWYWFNDLAALIGAISMLSYAFVYTPLKRISPIAILVGAIPGALPPTIGWVAATSVLSYEAYVLFAIQFLWQFPHFWAIGWLGAEEYAKAGFKLVPTPEERNQRTAIHVISYILILMVVSLFPTLIGQTSYLYAVFALLLGLFFLGAGIHLFQKCDNAAALKLMFASIIYLPLLQILMVVDHVWIK